jgi:hypothetical protein
MLSIGLGDYFWLQSPQLAANAAAIGAASQAKTGTLEGGSGGKTTVAPYGYDASGKAITGVQSIQQLSDLIASGDSAAAMAYAWGGSVVPPSPQSIGSQAAGVTPNIIAGQGSAVSNMSVGGLSIGTLLLIGGVGIVALFMFGGKH